MVGLKKKASERLGKVKFFEYDAFALSGGGDPKTLYAKYSRNCDCRDGVLTTGVGIKTFLMPDGNNPSIPTNAQVMAMHPIRQLSEDGLTKEETLAILLSNGMFYFYSAEQGAYQMAYYLSKPATSMRITDRDLKDTTVFVGPRGCLSCDTKGNVTGLDLPNNTQMGCACNNRLFIGVKPYTVAYSSPDNPLDFTETAHGAGKVHFPAERGEMVGIVNFKENVYVFFQYGIAKLETGGSPHEFRVKRLVYGGGKIFPYSMGVCGECVMFLAVDGIYRFDGEKTTKVEVLPVKPADNAAQWCCHASVEGLYILRFLDAREGFKIAVLYEDGKSGYFSDTFNVVHNSDGQAFCQYGLNIGTIAKDGDLYAGSVYDFSVGKTDFGLRSRKLLKSLRFEGEGAMSVSVIVDGETKTKRLYFVEGVAIWKLRERGTRFGFGIQPEKGARIRKMTAEIEYL